MRINAPEEITRSTGDSYALCRGTYRWNFSSGTFTPSSGMISFSQKARSASPSFATSSLNIFMICSVKMFRISRFGIAS